MVCPPPYIIFGCSYAYGQSLNYNQTLSYKLSEILKIPVYNRAIAGGGLQVMYMQVNSDSFYKEVPDFNTCIYVFMEDHYRRMLGETFFINDDYFYPYYKYNKGNLVYYERNNPIVNFFNSSCTIRLIQSKYHQYYLENPKNEDKITDFVLAYFIKTREKLESKSGHKIKFYVILYDWITYNETLKRKLGENNFIVIDTLDIAYNNNVSLSDEKYFSQVTKHPTEAVWDLLTPHIAEIIKN